MLRLLNKFADNLYRHKIGVASLLIEDAGVSLSLRRKRTKPVYAFFDSLKVASSSGANAIDIQLRGALCRVALPDTEFYYHLTHFTQLPSKPEAAQKFLEWRLREELGDVQEGCEVAFGAANLSEGACPTLLCKSDLKGQVLAELGNLGGRTEHVLPMGFYILAFLLSSYAIGRDNDSRLYVILWEDYWTLLVTDANSQLSHLRSCRWSSSLSRKAELRELQAEFRRLWAPLVDQSGEAEWLVLGDAALCRIFKQVAQEHSRPVLLLDGCLFEAQESSARQKFLLDAVMSYAV